MELRSIMEEYGAILKGHFILTSGRHSNIYLEKFRLLENPEMVDKIGEEIAKLIKRIEIDVVFGAAIGGIGTERFKIEEIATKNQIPILALVVKQSIHEAITLMTDAIANKADSVKEELLQMIRDNSTSGQTVLLIGVGNTIGVSQ